MNCLVSAARCGTNLDSEVLDLRVRERGELVRERAAVPQHGAPRAPARAHERGGRARAQALLAHKYYPLLIHAIYI